MSTRPPVPIAIIGMSCRYAAKSNSPEALWTTVAEGHDGWTPVPSDRFNEKAFYHPDPNAPGGINQKGGHFIDQDIASFDSSFFGISSLEAEALDPQQRVVLETAWEAVESAGIPMNRFKGSDTGVFVAMFGHDYEQVTHKDTLAFTSYHNTGVARPLLTNRVSYVFDLQGPSVMIDTACSGSLVAVNSACQSLSVGETDMALAGGVGLIFSPDQMALMSLTGLFNGEGKSFTFDVRGNGYGRGEGVGMVMLKRLDDAIRDRDEIRAVIRSSGANSDGKTNGITLPNQAAQERLARSLFRGLEFGPSDVEYAEAHGTGTKAGDAAEIAAIRNVFCQKRDAKQPLFVGTAKPNIGHSEAASGAAGLIKTVMAMEKGLIPPNILLENYKPGLEPEKWNMKLTLIYELKGSLTPWQSTAATRKAIVNSFGFGGTNAMVVLESAGSYGFKAAKINGESTNGTSPYVGFQEQKVSSDTGVLPQRLFTLSARSEFSLQHAVDDLSAYLERLENIDLDDLSYTLTSRRSNFPWRSHVIARDFKSLLTNLRDEGLERVKAPSRIANTLVFTGQGAQWSRMGYELLSSSEIFSKSIHLSGQFLKELGAEWSLIDELSRDDSSTRLNDSKFGQPVSTAVQVALVDLLHSWNIHTAAVIGHSSGEIAAAYAAGAISHSSAVRASYQRSFLSGLSRERSSQRGAMMAVGLGRDDVKRYIAKTAASGVEVACINSPSSTTVSGDATGISCLKTALDSDGVFARLLKVDTAYHSRHMRTVSENYLKRLEGLKSVSISPSIRFFSTVTGEEKHGGFGPSYWVENLVSPVQFCGALQRLYEEFNETTLNFIEVGPHKALEGPIRQTLAEFQSVGISYHYIPTLVRGVSGHEALLATGSSLFKSGSDLDTGAVASLGISKFSLSFVRDLPTYHWNHTSHDWAESRLSRDYRCRRHPHHDLLGSRTLTSPDSQPSWRTILRIDSLPWLKDHVVDNFVVFPAAGYMTMAIEAMRQLDQDRRPDMIARGYELKNVSFNKTLTIPKGARGIETVITFQYSGANENYGFNIFSVSEQGKWQEHCDGTIATVPDTGPDEMEDNRGPELEHESATERLQRAHDTCSKIVQGKIIYEEMAAMGNEYGPSFAVITEARMSEFRSLSNLTIPDIATIMPSQFLQPHIVHPSTLDAVIQTCVPLFQKHSVKGSVMPILIREVFVSAKVDNRPGAQLRAVCELSDMGLNSTNFSTTVFQPNANGDTDCVITMDGGEIRVVGEGHTLLHEPEAENIFRVQWGLDVSSISPEVIDSVTVPLQSDEIGMTQAAKVNATSIACARYMDWAVKKMRANGLAVAEDHRTHYWRILQKFVDSDDGQALIKRSPRTQDDLDKLTSSLGVEGEAIAKIGPEIIPILTGKTDPLAHFLQDELLFRVYHADECARPNRYVAEYMKHATFQKSNLRILEIGAGTGGTTFQIVQACSPDVQEFCSEYMYTDISSGFFESVRESRLKPWAHMLTFQTLDLEKDPAEQGFEEHAYDVVIAANVVHATRSLSNSLNSIHQLLKPEGLLCLVELTRSTPYINMTFGSISGWWAGVGEGRTDSPLQSPEKWDEHLRNASFSGVELAVHDLPEPERHSALLISKALPVPRTTSNGHISSHFHLLNGIPEQLSAHSFSAYLINGLMSKGFNAVLGDWEDGVVDDTCSYVILDSAEHRLLQNSSPAQFSRITSLLSKALKVYWISFADGVQRIVPDNAMPSGLARTARNEHPRLNCFTIDIQDSVAEKPDKFQEALLDFIVSTEHNIVNNGHLEFEVMYRNGKMQIQRFISDKKLKKALPGSVEAGETEETTFLQAERPLKVHVAKPGLLSSLTFVDDKLETLGPNEVEIEAHAWGVNFKDVFVALGQMKPSQTMTGETAGVLTGVGVNFRPQYKVGDRVTAMLGMPYASRARTDGHLIHRIPDGMSFTEAASIPLAFGTAYYGLIHCANLEQGQTVLIHAASGGVGQAAIKIAQRVGATIFATVGNASKRQLLVDLYGIPTSNIFSSRTTAFATRIKNLTRGAGVDVVLSSLAGPALQASWECIASLGCFVEIGKTDIYRRNHLDMEPFDRNVRFASVDMVVLSQRRPKFVQQLLQRIFDEFEAGHFSLLPMTTLQIGDIEKAFRLIQSRNHTGKLVMYADARSMVQAKIQPPSLRADGTYIIAGGLGGLGKLLCRHLQKYGASHICLLSRREFDDSSRLSIETELTEVPGSTVRVLTCDIAQSEAVKKMATELSSTMPPVRGVLHGAMLLSDCLVEQITQSDFEAALEAKYYGTNNLYDAFASVDLDFFVMLSSLSAVLGTLGQSNYAAGGAYQDMFTHSRVLAGQKNCVTLDFPLIRNTYPVSQERILSLARQGCQLVDIDVALSVINYAISGMAARDGCNQIAFGLDPQALIDKSKQDGRLPPLFAHITAQGRGPARLLNETPERKAEDMIALAQTLAEAEELVLEAIRDKIASLTALDFQELDVNTPVSDMALDSLIATELKNWITNTLHAPVQVLDIMDAPSLRALASHVSKVSSLVKVKSEINGTEINGTKTKTVKSSAEITAAAVLPKYPLQSLDETMEVFLESVAHMGNEEELQKTRKAIDSFLSEDGVGRRLQKRIEALSSTEETENGVVDVYVKNKWLRGRDWRPRLRNFFATLPLDDTTAHSQAERASLVTLAAYDYKLALDAGTVQTDQLNDQVLCMDTVYWLFNSNRTPALECDVAERWSGHDYVVAMRHGHAYKIPLRDQQDRNISQPYLKAIFEIIAEQDITEVNWASVLTTGNRDEWATIRGEVISASQDNKDFISAIEKCLFLVYLDDASPTNFRERAGTFLLDDNSNRWLDKTVGFVVCANGVTSMFCEHTMVDGTTFGGLINAIVTGVAERSRSPRDTLTPASSSSGGFSYLPFAMPPSLDSYVNHLRAKHIAAHKGYNLCNYEHTAYGAKYLRGFKLPPKTVIQLLIQIAVRRYFGYNPAGSVDVISQRAFKGGRTDMIYIATPEVTAFCAAAEDPTAEPRDRRRLFLDAVKSHARLVALSVRGRAWRWHIMALKEMLEPGEAVPELYADPVYNRTSERPVCTSFTEFGLPEMGRCQPLKTDVWVGVQVFEETVRFTVINGVGRSDEFVEHIKGAAEVMDQIIQYTAA